MNLFRLARFFQPLENPAGFGVADCIALGLALLLVAFFLMHERIGRFVDRFAAKTMPCMGLLAGLAVLLRVVMLPTQPVPPPRVPDEYSYVLSGDTIAHFRLANPMHPMHRFFEGVFTMQVPSWSSVYQLGQGLFLAAGQLIFGTPWAGVVISCAALCALCYWMLRGWTTPAWALVGGLLAVIQFGPLSAWMNIYWGGAVSAVAGCLIFGALPRLRDSRWLRYAALPGAGFGLQILSRPYESVFIALAVAVYALIYLRHRLRQRAVVAVALLSFLPACALTLLQNKQSTGQWTKLPYVESRIRYGIPTTFTFQPVPIPQGPLTIEQQLDYDAQVTVHGKTPETISTWLTRLVKRVAFYRFFFLAPLYLVLPAFFVCLRERVYWWVGGTILLLACGSNFYPYFYPHYVAAATCLFVLMTVKALENLGRLTIRGIAVGQETALLILVLCFAHFVLWYGFYAWGDANILLAVAPFERQYAIPGGDPDGRLAIEDQLRRTPGQHLVFVRYSPEHNGNPWIHNAADIDGSHVVWAIDLGEQEDAELIRYYPTRTVWLVEPDSRSPKLMPYGATPH